MGDWIVYDVAWDETVEGLVSNPSIVTREFRHHSAAQHPNFQQT